MKFDFVHLRIGKQSCKTNMTLFIEVWNAVSDAVNLLNTNYLGSTRQKMFYLRDGSNRVFSHQEVIIMVERNDFGWDWEENYRREYFVTISHRLTKASFTFKFLRTGLWMKDESLNHFDFNLVSADGKAEDIKGLATLLLDAWLNT